MYIHKCPAFAESWQHGHIVHVPSTDLQYFGKNGLLIVIAYRIAVRRETPLVRLDPKTREVCAKQCRLTTELVLHCPGYKCLWFSARKLPRCPRQWRQTKHSVAAWDSRPRILFTKHHVVSENLLNPIVKIRSNVPAQPQWCKNILGEVCNYCWPLTPHSLLSFPLIHTPLLFYFSSWKRRLLTFLVLFMQCLATLCPCCVSD